MQANVLHYQNTYLKYTADREETGGAYRGFLPSRGAEILLPAPQKPQATLSEALSRFSPHARDFTLQDLSNLCHHTLGFTRWEATDLYPIHRATPAPRCRYPIELNWWDGQNAYRYDPRRHTLTQAAQTVQNAGETMAAPGWIVSGVPTRLLNLYGHFASRLMLLTAGHALAQLQATLNAFDLPFSDPQVLDFEWPARDEEFPLVTLPCVPAERRNALLQGLKVPFLQATLSRSSACNADGNGVWPLSRDQSLLSLQDMLSALEVQHPDIQGHVYVLHAEGHKPGVYRAQHGNLHFLRPLPADLHDLFTILGFQARDCTSVWFLSAPTRLLSQKSVTGMAEAHLQAGQVAQRLGLAAGGHQLFARPSGSYHDVNIDATLHGSDTSHSVVYQLLVGHQRNPGFGIQLG